MTEGLKVIPKSPNLRRRHRLSPSWREPQRKKIRSWERFCPNFRAPGSERSREEQREGAELSRR
jgi:hypothetical protein